MLVRGAFMCDTKLKNAVVPQNKNKKTNHTPELQVLHALLSLHFPWVCAVLQAPVGRRVRRLFLRVHLNAEVDESLELLHVPVKITRHSSGICVLDSWRWVYLGCEAFIPGGVGAHTYTHTHTHTHTHEALALWLTYSIAGLSLMYVCFYLCKHKHTKKIDTHTHTHTHTHTSSTCDLSLDGQHIPMQASYWCMCVSIYAHTQTHTKNRHTRTHTDIKHMWPVAWWPTYPNAGLLLIAAPSMSHLYSWS